MWVSQHLCIYSSALEAPRRLPTAINSAPPAMQPIRYTITVAAMTWSDSVELTVLNRQLISEVTLLYQLGSTSTSASLLECANLLMVLIKLTKVRSHWVWHCVVHPESDCFRCVLGLPGDASLLRSNA